MFIDDYRDKVRFDEGKMQKITLFESHRMFADLYCLLPGQEQRAHTHQENDKVYVVLEGEGVFLVGTLEQRIGTGGCCIAPAGEPHGVRNDSDAGLVLLVTMAPHPSKHA
jgi:mannose-6-phosphate isomerase-like protein (cupin superfamily)